MHTHTHTHTHTHAHIHTHTHTHKTHNTQNTHTHTYTHTHTHTHTHTQYTLYSPMPSRGYKVKATMYTMILDVTTVQPRLIPEVSIILLIDVVNDRLPATCEK